MKNMIKTGAALVAATLFGGCDFSQPQPPCAVGHGGYSAELIHTGGATSGACFRTADIIGVQKYRQEDGTQDIYLRVESITALEYLTVSGTGDTYTLSTGTLASNEPNGEGYCTVGTLNPSSGTTLGGDDLTYTFSNVEFYVQGATPGTQFRADLTIDDGAGCTAQYDVRAMYPVVFCTDLDNETNPGAPNVALCDEPDHLWSHYAANPLFATKCHPYGNPAESGSDYDYDITGGADWHLCVPAGPIPSLR